MDHQVLITDAGLRTPRAAAAAGILFSLLLGLALILITVSAPSDPAAAGAWLTDPARRRAVVIALNLVPFAGIAFLWFIGVVRDRTQVVPRWIGLLGFAVAVVLLVSWV